VVTKFDATANLSRDVVDLARNVKREADAIVNFNIELKRTASGRKGMSSPEKTPGHKREVKGLTMRIKELEDKLSKMEEVIKDLHYKLESKEKRLKEMGETMKENEERNQRKLMTVMDDNKQVASQLYTAQQTIQEFRQE
jgi:predicted nuclease with TOPRIM domain